MVLIEVFFSISTLCSACNHVILSVLDSLSQMMLLPCLFESKAGNAQGFYCESCRFLKGVYMHSFWADNLATDLFKYVYGNVAVDGEASHLAQSEQGQIYLLSSS